MGAGHDGAARTLAEQLRAAGHEAEVKDFLTSGPLRIGAALRRGYEFELRHVPSAYDATYRLWYRVPWLCPVVAWLVTLLTRRRVLRWVDRYRPAVIVSTYPLSTLCLGRLRRTDRLRVPTVNFITDFGVHPLWVHKGVDANLAIHSLPAAVAERRTGRRTVCTGPAVSARFDPGCLPDRPSARARFGLGGADRAVLVVAGSWGVGNLQATWRAIAAAGRFRPVVVCGRDERLRAQMTALDRTEGGRSIILGWTDDMPALMVACDALVENAGGLTSLEAMRVGLPVVSFDPIPGHGVENTEAMDAAGVARLARRPADLVSALDVLTVPGPRRESQVARAAAMFRMVPAGAVLETASRPLALPSAARRRATLVRRGALAGAVLTSMAWLGSTTGVAMATDAGAGVARPAAAARDVVYLGVRLSPAEAADPAVVSAISRLGATAVIDEATARVEPAAIRALVTRGIAVASGGEGHGSGAERGGGFPWDQAALDARAGPQISRLIDFPITQAVPGRDLNAWDLVDFGDVHTTIVVPDHLIWVGRWTGQPMRMQAREIYLIDGFGASPDELVSFLDQVQASLGAAGLAAAPLGQLS
jgi:processive 1,2-diacylglycerol beta-glucosyltransferase